jgi:hypothetical protein
VIVSAHQIEAKLPYRSGHPATNTSRSVRVRTLARRSGWWRMPGPGKAPQVRFGLAGMGKDMVWHGS